MREQAEETLLRNYAELQKRQEKLRNRFASAVHDLRMKENELTEVKAQCQKYEEELREMKNDLDTCRAKNKELQKELREVREYLRQRNDTYQDDCITINRLQTAVDILASRLAAYTKG